MDRLTGSDARAVRAVQRHFHSKAVTAMQPSATMVVSSRARELKASGRDIISLGTGEPDFDTPEHIKEAAYKAARDGKTKYTAVNGAVELREAVAAKLLRENQLTYDPSEVIVCSGAKQAISNALIATIDAGDEVIVPVPCWVSYPELVRLLGGVPVFAETTDSGFKLTVELLERLITPRTKWLVLNSPCNPTGATYTRDELQALAQVLLRHPHVHVMSDDIYEHLVYDGVEFSTMAEAEPALKDRTLVINGVSKAFAMTGWRIGYAAGNAQLVKAMLKVQGQLTSGPNTIAQWAAVAALNGPMDEVNAFRDVYAKRRVAAGSILSATPGLQCSLPDGAFYLFPNCLGLFGKLTTSGVLIDSDVVFSTALLDCEGVAVVPGAAFGRGGYFRVSYGTATDSLIEACGRIRRFCDSLK